MSAPRLLKILLLTLAGLAVAFLVVRAAAPRVLPPSLAERIAPSNPDQLFRAGGRELVTNRGRLSEATYASVMDAATSAPLAGEPFMFAAVKALDAGDLRNGEALLTVARARNPRQSFVRIALLGIYLKTNRIEPAAQEVQALVRLLPQAEQVLVPELARLATQPETRPTMVQAFGADPIMASVLDFMASQNASPDLLVQLSARQPAATSGQLRSWQRKVLDSAIDRGQLDQAYAFWRRASGAPQGERQLVYDAGFQGLPGGEPFNWKLAQGGVGAAERSQGALSVEYFGRTSGPLAEQLLLLAPGRYRLSFRAEGNANAQGSRLLWQVECRGSANKLIEIPLQGVTFSPKDFAAEFAVPAGCGAQWLRLVGAAAEFPATQSAKISALTLSRVGGQP